MAGMTHSSNLPGMEPQAEWSALQLSRQQFKTIAWLRLRIFVNSLRAKGSGGELVARILSYPFLAILIFGPAIGAGFASWYLITTHMDAYLAIPLWVIFALWQFVGVSTSASGPSFDLSSLTRFPIRYRDYLLIRLSFGLLDPATLAGLACLLAVCIGIGAAAPTLLPWAAIALLLYAAVNILFSRMIYAWLERWLAQRKTRELVTVAILVGSLGIQVVSQFASRLSSTHHGPLSPAMQKASHILLATNWLLPPGLTATILDRAHQGAMTIAVAALVGLLLYGAVFLLTLHLRLHAEYMGENLSEAPAARQRKAAAKTIASTQRESSAASGRSLLPPAVAACLVKEFRYLLRSGPKLYSLIMPVFMVFLFSMRNSGMHQLGLQSYGSKGYLFAYGCIYLQLLLVALLYNSLGGDGAGAQFYFLAPVRMREMMLAKNLLIAGIVFVEVALIYLATAVLATPPPPAMVALSIAWTIFAFLINASVGNIRSLTSPKGFDPGKIRRQNVSGLSSLISMGVVLACAVLGWFTVFACNIVGESYWVAAAVFLVLAALVLVGIYLPVYRRLDAMAAEHVEDLARELSKA